MLGVVKSIKKVDEEFHVYEVKCTKKVLKAIYDKAQSIKEVQGCYEWYGTALFYVCNDSDVWDFQMYKKLRDNMYVVFNYSPKITEFRSKCFDRSNFSEFLFLHFLERADVLPDGGLVYKSSLKRWYYPVFHYDLNSHKDVENLGQLDTKLHNFLESSIGKGKFRLLCAHGDNKDPFLYMHSTRTDKSFGVCDGQYVVAYSDKHPWGTSDEVGVYNEKEFNEKYNIVL
jgi:hypothetical protein